MCKANANLYIFLYIYAMLCQLFAQIGKKSSHKVLTLFAQHSRQDLRLGVHYALRKGRVASLGIGGTIYHATNLTPGQRTATHHARLHRHIQRAVVQILTTERRHRCRYRLHLSVRRCIAKRLHQVVTSTNDTATCYNDCTNGHLSLS